MATRSRLRSLWAIMHYLGFTPMLRNPLFIPFVFSSPFTLLFILFVATNGTALPFGIAGALTMVTTELGLFVGTDLASYKIQNKFQDIVVASPVSPLVYMFGVALSELIFGTPALLVLFSFLILPTIKLPTSDYVGVVIVLLLLGSPLVLHELGKTNTPAALAVSLVMLLAAAALFLRKGKL